MNITHGSSSACGVAIAAVVLDVWLVQVLSLRVYGPSPCRFCKRVKVMKVMVWMGNYGALTAKPTWLYSNRPEIAAMAVNRFKCKRGVVALAKTHTARSGKKQVTGIPKLLKQSQSYPRAFGVCLAKLYKKSYDNIRSEMQQSTEKILANVNRQAGSLRNMHAHRLAW